MQEGLIAAWRSIGRFRGDARVSTWLYRIVLRKAYDVLDRRRRTAEPTDQLDLTAAAERPADDRLDIIAALGSLDPDFRAAVVACDIIGLSMDDAAAVLEVPPGTVRSRLSRAATGWRRCWRRTGHERPAPKRRGHRPDAARAGSGRRRRRTSPTT